MDSWHTGNMTRLQRFVKVTRYSIYDVYIHYTPDEEINHSDTKHYENYLSEEGERSDIKAIVLLPR